MNKTIIHLKEIKNSRVIKAGKIRQTCKYYLKPLRYYLKNN